MKKMLYTPVAICTFFIAVAITPLPVRQVPETMDKGTDLVAFDSDRFSSEPTSRFMRTKDNKYLCAVEILRHDPGTEISERIETNLTKANLDFELGLSESIENQFISLTPCIRDEREFKIEQQFETSMAIGDEGPHLDFTDWKHYTSDWKPIEKISDNRFLTSKLTESDYTRFPKVTAQEIRLLVSKEGGKRWEKLASHCKTANDGPCYVTVSRISLRISAKELGKWKEIHRINFSIPMGC